jgi:peroxiredoxin
MELEALEAAVPAIREAGASLVAISPQSQANSRKSVRQNGLSFPILSDPANAVAAAFGLRFRLSDELIALYRQLKNDLPAFNGDQSWTLPMPGRFVIAPDGVVRFAEVNPDYTRRPSRKTCCPRSEPPRRSTPDRAATAAVSHTTDP